MGNLGGRQDYDEDLGRRMARDARRVSDGELSEAEFHEKYHEEVLEEFGRDDRPLAVD
nr:4Fe-4S ferredoxin N-terminal domain-containing protein [Halodesulfurarchaeum formicicum]